MFPEVYRSQLLFFLNFKPGFNCYKQVIKRKWL